jgi:hypothetical protein
MEKMMREEIEVAAREILMQLDAFGDAPVLRLKDALGKPELYFYMGLGDLILRHRIAIQERQGVFWAIRLAETARAA